MKIALFHNVGSGGAKRAIFEWTKRLAANHQLDVFTLSSADHAFCDIRPLVHKHIIFDLIPQKLFGSPLGRLNQLQRWRDLGELTRIGQNIAREINLGNYDVVFANTCVYTFIPALLQFVEIPSVYYLHEPFGKRFTRSIQRPYSQNSSLRETVNRFDPLIHLYNQRLDAIQKKSVRRTDRLLANSQFTQAEMQSSFGVTSPVSHLGVSTDSFQPMEKMAKENRVLSVGELSPRKGFDLIVTSIGQIPQCERPQLRIVSNSVIPEERSFIQNLAEQQGVDLQVLVGLNVNELTLEYNKARVCAYAPVMEPFGLVPLEAMACGTPVVGVREGGVPESVVHEQTGLLVERNPNQFAQAIQSLMSRPNIASEYGRNGREYVLSNWTWDQSVRCLEKHLIQVSSKNQNHRGT